VSTEARTGRYRRKRAERGEARAFWGRRAPLTPATPAPAWNSFVRVFHRPGRVDPNLTYPLPREYLEAEYGS
jgi:hypothetical protein